MRPLLLLPLVALSTFLNASAANWPSWRGPTGDGVCTESNLPLNWSATENVKWSIPLPDRGNSTPVIWKDRIFLTQAVEKENRRTLMCLDRKTGKQLWQVGVTYTEKEPTHGTNPQCSASPVTDGERVIVSFGSAGLYCYDFSGKELWKRDLGKQIHIWGNATSPVLHGDTCFLNFGPGERTFLIAVDKRTGKTLWQHDEPGGHSGEKKPDDGSKNIWIGSWSDPIVRKTGGREELIMMFPGRVCAFDPKSGKELWTCAGLNPLTYTSPIYSDGIVVGMGGYNGMALAVKAGGSGDVTATHRLWQHPRTKQRIGSGVIHNGHIYILNDPGIAECFELKTGNLVWEERMKGPGPTAQNWSSLVLSGDRLYAVNQGGDASVFRASPKFELLATNPMGEKVIASVAVSDGDLFIRGYKHLWCIGSGTTGK
ncbi:MAG TPA: PQQ-binding-like beta-propeller repeat protein [Roseimicrobium sp.]|nr:PQQ-binding-like beta-propeller repeat protein [Roseimicrobium sp.]